MHCFPKWLCFSININSTLLCATIGWNIIKMKWSSFWQFIYFILPCKKSFVYHQNPLLFPINLFKLLPFQASRILGKSAKLFVTCCSYYEWLWPKMNGSFIESCIFYIQMCIMELYLGSDKTLFFKMWKTRSQTIWLTWSFWLDTCLVRKTFFFNFL